MMAPVTSTNYHYDYDDIQPYFLDGKEEDFYPPPSSHLFPGPNEDIWKKFELLPTPPLSPSRTPPQSDTHLSAAEHLEAVSDLLDEDWNPSAAFLQSFIIQDCMWSSSFAAATKLEQMVSERLACLRARRHSSDTSSVAGEAADPQVGRSQVNTAYLQDLHAAASQCIDPSVVIPCATTSRKQSADGAALEVESELCLDSLPLSSSDSESEEEEDGEEAEVDVVTVDRRQTSRRSDVSPLVLKRSHINIHQHNYAAPQPAGKRRKAESAASTQSVGQRCWSPRSDGEDENKRRTHNVLEKQRRSELRLSFLTLRDEVPAVANNEKAAKVMILKKTTEFIMELTEEEKRLQMMKDRMMKRNKELKRRLEKLRTLRECST